MSARHTHWVPRLEQLESRQVLANWGVSVVDGVLTIEGTNKNDRIVVAVADELGNLSVQFNTKPAEIFNPLDADPTKAFTSIVINGYGGNDRITVGAGVLLNATIDGGTGNDWIWGGGGADVIHAGKGNDHVYGCGGDDQLFADAGNDKMWGGAGNDVMEGDIGHDWLRGNDGDDDLLGGDGHDHLHGGAGADEAWGGTGFDHLHGEDGDDFLYGEDGHDLVYGELGNDLLDGGSGKDKLWGGAGDDRIKGGWGNDHLNGGDGNDLLDGDEGTDHEWNGASVDLDLVELAALLSSPSGAYGTAQFGYEAEAGDTAELVLEIEVHGAPAGVHEVYIDGVLVGSITVDALGDGTLKFSSNTDDDGDGEVELLLPAGLNLQVGSTVLIGTDITGTFAAK
jgi:Ca2+-binding RTX toxin-like protein